MQGSALNPHKLAAGCSVSVHIKDVLSACQPRPQKILFKLQSRALVFFFFFFAFAFLSRMWLGYSTLGLSVCRAFSPLGLRSSFCIFSPSKACRTWYSEGCVSRASAYARTGSNLLIHPIIPFDGYPIFSIDHLLYFSSPLARAICLSCTLPAEIYTYLHLMMSMTVTYLEMLFSE